MKVLILGKGYVGTALAKRLKQWYNVVAISKNEFDYTDRALLFTHLTKTSDERYEFVINTCGYTGRPNVDACEDNIEDTWYYNVIVPVNIQKACKDAGVRMIHISSGCIYSGYDKYYTEEDEPDFGLLEPKSSWYSKTKHACEMMLKDKNVYTMRIRMPFCETWSERSVLTKLIKYDNVINCLNSLTNLEDLCGFITYFIEDIINPDKNTYEYGIYNVVNPEPIETAELLSLIDEYGLGNPNWKHIELQELYRTTKTQRSNCVLSDEKISNLNLKLPKTRDSLKRCLEHMRNESVQTDKT